MALTSTTPSPCEVAAAGLSAAGAWALLLYQRQINHWAADEKERGEQWTGGYLLLGPPVSRSPTPALTIERESCELEAEAS
jgi:hypothetical protein